MKNENEAANVKVNYNSQPNESSQNNTEIKNESTNQNTQETKPKLKINAQSYIPKFVRKTPEVSTPTEKLSETNKNPFTNNNNNQTTSNPPVKPANPTYIPYQGGSSINPQGKIRTFYFSNKWAKWCKWHQAR